MFATTQNTNNLGGELDFFYNQRQNNMNFSTNVQNNTSQPFALL